METYHTHAEIKSQTRAWAEALDLTSALSVPKAGDYSQTVFTGCGSTYYLSLAAAAMYQELTGRPARAAPAGELLLNSQTVLSDKKTLLIAISRSGTTTETLKAVEKFKKEQRGDVLAISNYNEALIRLANLSVVIESGQEESIAQTRSFASMFIAASTISARMAGRNDVAAAMAALPAAGDRLMADYESYARAIGEDLRIDRFYFLGSGIRYGLACESSLKMKEMTLSHSEPFHFLEFRHGPMNMVNRKTVIVGMLSDANWGQEAKVLTEMGVHGSMVVGLGEQGTDVNFGSGIPESARAPLYLPVLQLLAFYRSVKKGLNPDKPNNLAAVVTLDL